MDFCKSRCGVLRAFISLSLSSWGKRLGRQKWRTLRAASLGRTAMARNQLNHEWPKPIQRQASPTRFALIGLCSAYDLITPLSPPHVPPRGGLQRSGVGFNEFSSLGPKVLTYGRPKTSRIQWTPLSHPVPDKISVLVSSRQWHPKSPLIVMNFS